MQKVINTTMMRSRKKLFLCLVAVNAVSLACCALLHLLFNFIGSSLLNDYDPGSVVSVYEDTITAVTYSQRSRSLFLLGKTALRSAWNGTTIFGGDSQFITLGVPEHGQFFGPDMTFSSLFKNGDCSTARIFECRHSGQGTTSQNCNLVSDCSQPIFSSTAITHIYIKQNLNGDGENDPMSVSLLIARLYLVSPPNRRQNFHLFCYGLPSDVLSLADTVSACPPCLCPAIFAGRTLLSQKKILEVSSLFNSPADLLTGIKISLQTPEMTAKLRQANHLFRHSQFVSCLAKNETAINRPSDIFLNGDSEQFGAAQAWAVHELFRQRQMPLVLEGGTLLGWYRNCSVIKDDIDVDFSVPSWSINKQYYDTVLESAYINKKPVYYKVVPSGDLEIVNEPISLKTTRIFGDHSSGIEVRFDARRQSDSDDKPVVSIDVFTLFIDDDDEDNDDDDQNEGQVAANRHHHHPRSYHYILGFFNRAKTLLHYEIPKNGTTLCSTIFLGELYHVPCNPAIYLESHYGKGWRYPASREDAYWANQPNIVKRIKLQQMDWRRRKMFRSFETIWQRN